MVLVVDIVLPRRFPNALYKSVYYCPALYSFNTYWFGLFRVMAVICLGLVVLVDSSDGLSSREISYIGPSRDSFGQQTRSSQPSRFISESFPWIDMIKCRRSGLVNFVVG
jgi:hypothetical protein